MAIIPNNLGITGRVFVCSDPHFGHESILRFERREFATIEEHDNHIIDSINKIVRPTDTLIILGDLGTNWYEQVDAIKTRKRILILGNHDRESEATYERYFERIIKGPIYYNSKVILCHEPVDINTDYVVVVHGHLHGSRIGRKGYINASLAMINYTPINMATIVGATEGFKKHKARFGEEWYSNLYRYDIARTHDKMVLSNGEIYPQWKEINGFMRENDIEIVYQEYDWDKFDKELAKVTNEVYSARIEGGEGLNEVEAFYKVLSVIKKEVAEDGDRDIQDSKSVDE